MTKSLFGQVSKTIRERGKYYGKPEDNYRRTADLWSEILKTKVKPKDVLLCMVATKLCREIARHKRDNIVDMAGYLTLYINMEDKSCKRFTKRKKIK